MNISNLTKLFIFYISLTFGLSVFANDRLALIIGNASYQSKTLKNPINDATDIASVLQNQLGFKVFEYHNLGRVGMLDAVNDFQNKLEAANQPIAFFYYAGHGIQEKNFNYLIPIDEHIRNKHQIKAYGINVNTILESIKTRNLYLGVALLDACRDNPYTTSSRGFGLGRGLARAKEVSGLIIGYATKPGSIAKDGAGRNSPYASVLKKVLTLKNYSVQDMLNEVGLRVKRFYGQEPWISVSPVPRVVLKPNSSSFRPQNNLAMEKLRYSAAHQQSSSNSAWRHPHPAIPGCTAARLHSHKYNKNGKPHNHKYACSNESQKKTVTRPQVDIRALQDKLRAEGYYKGPSDGIVGPETRSALKRFMNR